MGCQRFSYLWIAQFERRQFHHGASRRCIDSYPIATRIRTQNTMATDLQTRNSLGDTDSINLEESRAILRRLKDEAPLTDNEHVPEPIAPPPSGAENSSNRPQSPQLSGPASRNAPPPPKLSLRLVRPTEIASKPRMGPYISFTKQISEKFPQLAVISAVPEYESPLNVGVIDILPNNRFRCKTFTDHCEPMVEWKSNFSGKELELLEFLRQDIEEDVRYRLILVEDLSPGVLEILGSTLEVDPEFFAEHLHDSGYSEEHKNRPVKEWNTGGCKKQYVSMQWNRPVCLSKGDLAHAKDQKFGQISRSYQELFAVPIEEQIGSEDLLNIVGWDERVSVWDSEDRYCIVLLDPVPTTIQTEIKITKVPLTQEIVDEYDKKKVPQFMRKKYETRREKIYHPNPFYPLPCRQRNVASVLPKFSDFDFESRDGTFAKELLSHNRKSTMEIFLKWIETPPFADMPTNLSAYTHCLLFLLIIIQRDKTELIYQMGKEIEIINSQLPLDFVVQRRVFYWRMLLVLFRERLQITMRMVDSSLTILESLQATETAEENSSPQMGIPRIPSIGIKAAVGSVSSRMPTFRSTASPRIAGALRELSGEFIVLEQQTIWLSERVEQTLQSLMSTLSIIESQRAISEAESVTKLTELAFFFIPLSFSATLFGMQIQEFENRVPIAFWVGVAILITASSYGLRFATRSFLMSQLKRRLVESVRNHAGLRREEVRIPNRAFFVWLLSVLKPPSELISSFLVGGGGGVLLIIVISLLWIKGALLNTVFKVALTVLLLGMFTLAMAAVLTPGSCLFTSQHI
ncbi:hypothetical protein BDD12DRAFT_138647 [Trichophaea hybrida]|nr:hypothetical protein BDD12DRAFT_138647 [Trichophaea hybrida]